MDEQVGFTVDGISSCVEILQRLQWCRVCEQRACVGGAVFDSGPTGFGACVQVDTFYVVLLGCIAHVVLDKCTTAECDDGGRISLVDEIHAHGAFEFSESSFPFGREDFSDGLCVAAFDFGVAINEGKLECFGE